MTPVAVPKEDTDGQTAMTAEELKKLQLDGNATEEKKDELDGDEDDEDEEDENPQAGGNSGECY
jgi:hypothetical protein